MIHRIDRVNPDVDDRVIKPNEARMATNLRFGASTEDTNLSGGTLILGNQELPFTPPEGDNKVVGVYADLESRNVFFALYNSLRNHGIYRIDGNTNEVKAIIGDNYVNYSYGEFLNFQAYDEYDVSMAYTNGLLYWTDNVNEPRVINVEKGIRTMDGGVDDIYLSPGNAENYSQVKRPPGAIADVYRIQGSASAYNCYNTIYSPLDIQRDWTSQGDFTGEKQALWRDTFVNDDGIQFSYYYVYDNNEESKLAPWSEPVFYKDNIVVQVPQSEFAVYCAPLNIIKRVVFVYRTNNDGVPCVIRYVDNVAANYKSPSQIPPYFPNTTAPNPALQITIQDIPSLQTLIDNTTYLSKSPVSTDIAEQRFDSVPLLSTTNTIAQNRLNHGNYVLDRDTWSELSLSLEVEQVPFPSGTSGSIYVTQPAQKNIFKSGGLYEIGIELLDEAGRPIGVVNNQEVTIPEMRIASNGYPYKNSSPYISNPKPYVANYDDAELNVYKVKYAISGGVPSWAKYMRVVSSGVKNVNYFHRTVAPIFYWYQASDGTNLIYLSQKLSVNTNNPDEVATNVVFGNIPSTIIPEGSSGDKKVYQLKGYAVDVSSVPVTYSDEESLYIKIGPELYPQKVDDLSQALPPVTENTQEYKVVGSQGSLFFIETSLTSIYPSIISSNTITTGPAINVDWWENPAVSERLFFLLFYNIEVYSKKTPSETIFYQNTDIIPIDEYVQNNLQAVGYAKGDCYISSFNRTWTCSQSNVAASTYDLNTPIPQVNSIFRNFQIITNSIVDISGTFISMNPVTANSAMWTWEKGQPGVVNDNQRRTRIDNGIIFSSPIIQQTQINGLNQFNSLDSRLAPIENGPITSLVTTNATQREPGVLLSIGSFGVSSFYYDAIQLSNVDGTSNVATTNSYLASQRPLLGQYGTSRPMSVTKTPLGTVYWWSDVVNDLIRYTNAGLERLGMTFSFANYLRRNYNNNPLLITWYDQVTDEVSLLGRGKNTAVFSERYKTFQGEREYYLNNFYPERGAGLPTKQFLFVNGKIWMTDVELNGLNAPDDNFIFGSYKNPSLDVVTNESPAVVKRWNQIKVFGSRPQIVQLEAPNETEGASGVLESYVEPGWWIKRKGDWEAAIRRASNSQGGVLEGKLMESRIIYSKFAFSAQGFQKLNFVEVKSNVSIVQ